MLYFHATFFEESKKVYFERNGATYYHINGKKQSKVHQYTLLFAAVTHLVLLWNVVSWLWEQNQLSKAAVAMTAKARLTLAMPGNGVTDGSCLCQCHCGTWMAKEFLLFYTIIFRLNKTQHLLQSEKLSRDFQSASQIWLQVSTDTNCNILMQITHGFAKMAAALKQFPSISLL